MPLIKYQRYSLLKIEILAKEDEINGPDELALSDALYEIQISLERWLEEQAGNQFQFRIHETS